MAAVEGETPACLTRMAEKAIVSAPAMAIARGRAARAVTTAGMAGAVVGANAARARAAGAAARTSCGHSEPPSRNVAAAACRFGRKRTRRPPSVPVTAPRRLIFRVPFAVPLTCTVPEIDPAAGGQRAADAQAGHEGVAAQAQAALEARLGGEAPAAQPAAADLEAGEQRLQRGQARVGDGVEHREQRAPAAAADAGRRAEVLQRVRRQRRRARRRCRGSGTGGRPRRPR